MLRFLAASVAFGLTLVVVVALWLGWIFSKPGSSRQLGMLVPEVAAFFTGTHATAETALLSWDPAQKRVSLRWSGAVFASPRQPGVLAVRRFDADLRYDWDADHFFVIELLTLDQPRLFLPKRAQTTRSDPFLIPALQTLERLHWPFAFLKRLEIRGGYIELGRQQAVSKINLTFAATPEQPPLLLLSGHWLKQDTVIPLRARAEQLPDGQFDLRVIADSARILSPQFETGELFLADARAHLRLMPRERRLHLVALHLDTADVPIQGRAILDWNRDLVNVAFATQTGRLNLEQVAQLWPLAAGVHARDWVIQHLSAGTVTRAQAQGRLRVPLVDPARTRLDALDGTLDLSGFQINYLPGMPPVTGASGTATFDAADFRIKLTEGVSQGVRLAAGDLHFTAHPELGYSVLDLVMKLEGRLADQLAIVRAVPAVGKTDWGFSLDTVTGHAITDLVMHIPLEIAHEHHLTLAATSRLRGAGLPLADGRWQLADASATVNATLERVTADIEGTLNGVPITLAWMQPLTDQGTWSVRFDGRGDAALWDDLARVPLSRWTSGMIAAKGQVDGSGNAAITATLTGAALQIDAINWQKPVGEPAVLDVRLSDDGTHYHFDYTGQDERFRGLWIQTADGAFQSLNITHGQMGRSQVHGDIAQQPDGVYRGTFAAETLDLSGLIADDTTKPADRTKRSWGWTSLPPLLIEARIKQLWLAPDTPPVTGTELSLKAGNRGLERLALRGTMPGDRDFSANIFPDDSSTAGDLQLRVHAHDAGGFLRTFGIYDNIRGGTLNLAARLPRMETTAATGTLQLSAFSLMQAPVLARLLSVASLTGPLNLLTGQGISFDGLYAEWQLLEDDILMVQKGLMAGTSLGLQAEGRVDLGDDTLNLTGAVVPLYVLNSVIGNIPILGDLLTRNRQEGLIAMRYRMKGPMQDPDISVNPLTVLTPGFLRGFFDLFKDAPQTATQAP